MKADGNKTAMSIKILLIVLGAFLLCTGITFLFYNEAVGGYAFIALGMILITCGVFMKFVIKHCVPIALAASGISFVALLIMFQKDEAYLYDISILHSVLFYVVAAVVAAVTVVALIVKKHSFKKSVVALNILGVFLLLIYVILQDIFCFWVSASKTNDIENYKKFDIQVHQADKSFFPDLKESYEIIKYDYYYSFPYHHVYSIYLEIKVDGNVDELLNSYRKGEYEEKVFEHDITFMEICFEDDFEYEKEDNTLYTGNIKKILYSTEENIVIFQCFESWAFCQVDDVYYFERFNIDPAKY